MHRNLYPCGKKFFSAAKRKTVGIFNGFLWNTNKEMIFRFKMFWVNMTWEKKCIEWTWNSVWMKKKKVHNKINFKFVLVVEEDFKIKMFMCQFSFNFFVFICRNYMNDSFRTEVFVRFQPETIACACIYLAARQLQVCSKCFFHYMHIILNFTLVRSF